MVVVVASGGLAVLVLGLLSAVAVTVTVSLLSAVSVAPPASG